MCDACVWILQYPAGLLSASAALQEEEEEEGGGEEGTSWEHGSLSAFPAVTSRQVVVIEMKRAKRGQLTD